VNSCDGGGRANRVLSVNSEIGLNDFNRSSFQVASCEDSTDVTKLSPEPTADALATAGSDTAEEEELLLGIEALTAAAAALGDAATAIGGNSFA
jgi:hypothetical protein